MKHTTKTADGHLQKELPDIIYLQLHGDSEYVGNNEEIDFGDVTWSEDRMYPTDVEYAKVKSSWISVEERLPEYNTEVIIYHEYRFYIGFMYYSMMSNWWRISEDERTDMIVSEDDFWMPIPSFDEILEANKDVLERIKQKGD